MSYTQLLFSALVVLSQRCSIPATVLKCKAACHARGSTGFGLLVLAQNIDGGLLACSTGVPATIDALPAIVATVGKRVPVLIDGGIRRGTDIIKVRIAMGKKATMPRSLSYSLVESWSATHPAPAGARLCCCMFRSVPRQTSVRHASHEKMALQAGVEGQPRAACT